MTLAAAIALAGNKPTTVYVTAPVPIAANLTIPSNVEIVRVDGGRLEPAAGVVVRCQGVIRGNVNTPAWGPDGIVKLRNTLDVYPGEFGVKGDGITDDTAALQRCIDSVPPYSRIVLPTNLKCRLTAPLRIHKKLGLSIQGACQVADIGALQVAADMPPTFFYDGTPGEIPVVDVDGCAYLHLENLCIHANAKAKYGLNIDRSGPNGSTSHITARCLSLANPKNIDPDSVALRIAAKSPANVEHLRFSVLLITWPNGIGVQCGADGGSANSLTNVIEHAQFSRCRRAIDPGRAYWRVTDSLFNQNETDFYFSFVPSFVLIEYCRSELCKYFIDTDMAKGGQKSLVLQSNVVTAVKTPAGEAIMKTRGGSIGLYDNQFPNNAAAGDDAVWLLRDAGGSASLHSFGNTWPGKTHIKESLDTIQQGAILGGDYYQSAQGGVGLLDDTLYVERAGAGSSKNSAIRIPFKDAIYGTDATGNPVKLVGIP